VEGKPHAEISKVIEVTRPRRTENIRLSPFGWEPISGFDHIFYRTDPPVDLSYLLPLQILASSIDAKRKRPQIHSSPESLFFMNEKWAAAGLGTCFPKSLVSASVDRLATFAEEVGKVVIKPLYLAQSKGVEVIDTHSFSIATVRDRMKRATEDGRLPIIVQEFLPGISEGETRLWFVNGKLLATVRKKPLHGETIIDMDRGGTLGKWKINSSERRVAAKISTLLKQKKILYAAVDLIDGKITDFNHTSPGLLVSMEDLLGENLAKRALSPILRRRR
jgi:glutathione synthase